MELECHLIIDNLIPELEELSKQKYGSNVLEKVNNVRIFRIKSFIFR